MEEIETVDNELVKQFNNGYLLAKYEPELADQLSKINAVSPGILALKKGREQYLREQIQEKLPTWLKENPTENNKQIPSKNRDKDRSPERE